MSRCEVLLEEGLRMPCVSDVHQPWPHAVMFDSDMFSQVSWDHHTCMSCSLTSTVVFL